jgi:hypothetical protein
MPRQHGQRLADPFPTARLVLIQDNYALIPENQPAKLSAHPRAFTPDRAPDVRQGEN